MAIKTLAVKYRPISFDDVVEQDEVKAILRQQLQTGTTKNAYLFVGSAGTGKTTCARIFANEINKFKGNPIEMDAASNNSVEDARDLIQQANTKSIDSDYKVFIIDECFPSNTQILTQSGNKFISEIVPGDNVQSMSGLHKVTNVFKNSVLTNRLCCVKIGDRNIITTIDHLFFTENGWIKAQDLRRDDIIYDSKNLSKLWKRISSNTKSQRCKVLLSPMFSRVSKKDLCTKEKNYQMSDMWDINDSTYIQYEKDLLKEMQGYDDFHVRKTDNEYRIRYGVTETIIRAYVEEQSDEGQKEYTNNAGYEREESDTTPMAYKSWWKWEIYNSADTLVASIREWLGIRISDKYKKSELARKTVTVVLQSRPWLTKNETCDRGGWHSTQMEKQFIKRCKKDRMSNRLRVESVEIYKRGYNDELFRSSFTDTELSGEYVTMYDLEVEHDHCYFANDVLVHNCHMLTNAAWNALLKLIEEPPAMSIFVFCTTDPQKIPKTILSRVQRYDFQRISTESIADRLKFILGSELNGTEHQYDTDAIKYIAKVAAGGMRDAITMLDKCLSYSEDLTLENVVKALGLVDYDKMIDLASKLLVSKDAEGVLNIIEDVHNAGKDLKQFMKTFTNFVLDLCKYANTRKMQFLDTPAIHEDDVAYLSEQEDCVKLLSELIKLNAEIKWDTSPRGMIEATLLLQII